MYLAHYGLAVKPFQISTDPAFLWLGPKHREALSILKYGILDNRGFLLLTGDVGTGKTTLIHALLQSLSREVLVATVPDPGLTPLDFFNYISRGFNLGTRFASKGEFLDHFMDFLEKSHREKKRVLIIIDEAQRLTARLIEEVRVLSNIEKAETKLLNIFFVGQNEFNDMLLLPEHRALRQRITVNYHIEPLKKDETGTYIRHRLEKAGAKGEIFDAEAIDAVHRFSKGYPRLINIVCDHGLIAGYAAGKTVVTGEMIRRCAADLALPKKTRIVDAPEPDAKIEVSEPGPETPEGDMTLPDRGLPPAATDRVVLSKPGKSASFWVVAAAAGILVLAAGYFFFFRAGSEPVAPPDSASEKGAASAPVTGFKTGDEGVAPTVPVPAEAKETPSGEPPIPSDRTEPGEQPPAPERAELPPPLETEKPFPPEAAVQDRGVQEALSPPPHDPAPAETDGASTPEGPSPDPADAIDWLIKKQREKP